ncbi:DUF3107 domain-containing protein [uncultured Aeromicrobium sp.]|uniref:DUF3107 domain-containing protein n=1 Tax=uncultured Aeromicrobium sp. TaxID=337820 RepID=UPI0025F228E0|nr:DUF3107 domain-containing protein [uncultured Aeromicrobium sp.]
MTVEVKIGVQNASRELSVETDAEPDAVLTELRTAMADNSVFTITDAKGRTVAVPADKVAYLYFTSDSGRKVGFGLT